MGARFDQRKSSSLFNQYRDGQEILHSSYAKATLPIHGAAD